MVNHGVTLKERLQDAVHYALRQKPPLEDSMVGAACADDPLQVVGPTNVGYMSRVTNVLLEFGSLRNNTQSLEKNIVQHS